MLLNKTELNLAKLASDDESRYALQGIAVQEKHTVVTNGHYLVTVTHSEMSADSYPATEGLEHAQLTNGGTVLVSKVAALNATKALPKKNTVPVLGCAALATDGRVFVNNLESVQSFKSDLTGKFPNWEMVIPKGKPKAEVAVSSEYLRLLADYFDKEGNGEVTTVIRLTVYDAQTAIRFDAKSADGQDIMAVLMPMRMDKAEFAQRPDQLPKPEKKSVGVQS